MQLPAFNLNSKDHISALLFGGKIKVMTVEPILNSDGTFLLVKTGEKAGQVKVKKVEKEVSVKGLGLIPDRHWKTKKEGVFQTNVNILKIIAQDNEDD